MYRVSCYRLGSQPRNVVPIARLNRERSRTASLGLSGGFWPTSLFLFQVSRDCEVFMAHSNKKDGRSILKPRSGEGSRPCRWLPLEHSQPAGPCPKLAG